MGIGIVFDTTLMALSKGLKGGADAAMEQVARRNASVEKQTTEAGVQQVAEPNFRGHKNKSLLLILNKVTLLVVLVTSTMLLTNAGV